MKTHTHTSSPWAIGWESRQLSIYCNRNTKIAEVYGKNNIEALDNACLIASAPEMLEALKSLTHPMASDDDLQNALAVIAKVERGDA